MEITPSENGLYWCYILDKNDCVSDTAFYEYQSFDIYDLRNYINVFPSQEYIRIETSLIIDAVKLTDINGRERFMIKISRVFI